MPEQGGHRAVQRIPREQARKYAFDWRDEPLLRVAAGRDASRSRPTTPAPATSRRPADKAIPAQAARLRPHPAAGQPDRRAGLRRGRRARRHAGRHASRTSWSTTTRGSPSARAAARSANRRAGRSCRASTRRRSSGTRPARAARRATARCTSATASPGRSRRSSARSASRPDREVTTSLDGQGEWGGNLDIRDVAPGNRILLPIFHPGALFYLGDVHASQGDTEFTGTAAETKATVRAEARSWSRASASRGCGSRSRSRSCRCTRTGRWKWPSRRRRST